MLFALDPIGHFFDTAVGILTIAREAKPSAQILPVQMIRSYYRATFRTVTSEAFGGKGHQKVVDAELACPVIGLPVAN